MPAAHCLEAGGDAIDGDDDPLDDAEAATCFAEGIVKDLGLSRLAEVGLTADTDRSAITARSQTQSSSVTLKE